MARLEKDGAPLFRGDKRDSKGRFLKGTAPGPGRPPRKVEESYYQTLRANLSQERFAELVERVIQAAERGNERALETLLRYVLPTPEQRIRIEQEAHGEIRVAGLTPAEFDAETMRLLAEEIQKRRAFGRWPRNEEDGDGEV